MFDLWTKTWRRNRIVKQPIPDRWSAILSKSLWYWRVLTPEQRTRLMSLVAIFLSEKEIVVPSRADDAERVRVTVAAAASLMLLGFEDWYCFDRIQTIVLSPRSIVEHMQVAGGNGIFGDVVASGIYTSGSPVQLNWRDVEVQCANPNSAGNVVIHEFAHHVDDLDGSLAGDPPFPTRRLAKIWREVATDELERLEQQYDRGEETILDPYGMSNPVEFFAVACEAYFCRPHELYESHPQLFGLLTALFHLDPRPWFVSFRR